MPKFTGFKWPDPHVSVSYIPDGAEVVGFPSNLFALYDAHYPRNVWQGQIDRALKTWQASSGLIFRYVGDDGSNQNVPAPLQNDPRFGDIRIGASLGVAMLDDTTVPGHAGAVLGLNGSTVMGVTGAGADLYSVVLHSLGGSLGLAENQLPSRESVMDGPGPFTGLFPIDIEGIQMLYGLPATPPPRPWPQAKLAMAAGAFAHGEELCYAFVAQCYQKYLGRTASPAEIAGWATQMLPPPKGRNLSSMDIATAFLGSQESWNLRGGDARTWILWAYQNELGRTPSETDVAGWGTNLNS